MIQLKATILVLASDPSGLVVMVRILVGVAAGIAGFTSMLLALEGPGKKALAKAFGLGLAVGVLTYVALWFGLAALMSH